MSGGKCVPPRLGPCGHGAAVAGERWGGVRARAAGAALFSLGRMAQGDGAADIHFYFDPVCPFAWLTSRWVRTVMAQREYSVDWRFISLRMVNADVDYEAQFPPEYEAGHTTGLRLLRVAARARAEHGPAAVGLLYDTLGRALFDSPSESAEAGRGRRGPRGFL